MWTRWPAVFHAGWGFFRDVCLGRCVWWGGMRDGGWQDSSSRLEWAEAVVRWDIWDQLSGCFGCHDDIT